MISATEVLNQAKRIPSSLEAVNYFIQGISALPHSTHALLLLLSIPDTDARLLMGQYDRRKLAKIRANSSHPPGLFKVNFQIATPRLPIVDTFASHGSPVREGMAKSGAISTMQPILVDLTGRTVLDIYPAGTGDTPNELLGRFLVDMAYLENIVELADFPPYLTMAQRQQAAHWYANNI